MKYTLLLMLPMLALAGPPTEAPAGAERKLIAAVIIAEAGGEDMKGMKAVYEVIWQRGVQRKRSLAKVVTRPKQFSCLNRTTTTALIRSTSRHPRYQWVHDELLKHPPLTVHTCPAHLLRLATNRANHYHAVSVTPYWAKGKTGVTIGNHRFYKLK